MKVRAVNPGSFFFEFVKKKRLFVLLGILVLLDSLVASPLVPFHVTSHTKGLSAAMMGALEWFFTSMTVAMYP